MMQQPYLDESLCIGEQDLTQLARLRDDETLKTNRADRTDDGAVLIEPLLLRNPNLGLEDVRELAKQWVANRRTGDMPKRREKEWV